MEDVNNYRDFMDSQAKSKSKQSEVALGKLSALVKPVVERFKELEEEKRVSAKDYIRRFCKSYSYVTQLVRIHDEDLFNEFLFTSQLIKFLPSEETPSMIDIEDKIKLEYASLKESYHGSIILDKASVELTPTSSLSPKKQDKKTDTLQSIIDKVNLKFDGDFTESDRVIVQGIYQMFMNDSEVKKLKQKAKGSSSEMFVKSLFPDKFKEIVVKCYMENNESFQKLFSDNDFYKKVMETMAKEMYKEFRKD